MSDQSSANAVAVIGMAGRFPGARTIAEFWRNLRNGVESIRTLSDEELASAGVDPALSQDSSYVRAAAVLDGIDLFDAAFFGFSPRDARIMDPQHRLFLECAWEALEHAGWRPDNFPGTVGVYAGSGMNAYLIFNLLTNRELMKSAGLFLLKQTGNDKDVLATRLSYQMNFTGPSMTIQTACSTSLVAVHTACQSLLHHECDMALAGGVTIEIPHATGYLYREGEILSRDGHCRAFDANSSGTVFGSGAGMVVLRRLEDALQDGDSIHAVILGTAINNDGARKVGYLAPSVAGQTDVIAEALGLAGVDAESIHYVETHGTGTSVGDPIEVAALTQAFRQSTQKRGFCGIGSLKTNIGHLDAAAGVSGLIKTILALKHRELPPSLNFARPNPLIDFENSPFYVNNALTEWKANGGPRRAGVTSLGIGGTNAHVILEEAPPLGKSGESRPWQVLTVSARTPAALETAANNLAGYLEEAGAPDLADVAFTCHLGRKSFTHRRAVVCRTSGEGSLAEAGRLLRKSDPRRTSAGKEAEVTGIAFLFPGQGAQYPNMARGIYETEPVFRSAVDTCCELLAPGMGFDLRLLLFPLQGQFETAQEQLAQTWITQPALFTIEFALAKLWMHWGIRPSAMIGHSIGEFAAACIAGVFSLEDAVTAVAARGRLMQSARAGAMLAVALPEQDALALLSNGVCLAAINAPNQCVLSGTSGAVDELEKRLARDGITCHRLRTSHAFHSESMEPILGPFKEVMAGLRLNPPAVPYISNVTGTWVRPEDAVDPSYWARHLREPVRFSEGLQKLLSLPCSHLLEVGPGRALSSLSGRSGAKALASVRSASENRDDSEYLLTTVGQLWTSGVAVNWSEFHGGETRRRVPLPTYPFERQRFWVDAPAQSALEATARNTSALPAVSQPAAAVPADGLLYYRPVWKRSELAADATGSGPWLIFADQMGLGSQIVKLLEAAGQETITVTPGERFTQSRNRSYTIQPGHKPDYESLVADLIRHGRAPQRIVHLWALIPDSDSASPLTNLEQTQNLCFHSLMFLAQACGTHDLTHPIELGIVSNGLQKVASEAAHHPERSILLGPARVIPKEFSNVGCRAIDLPSEVVAANLEKFGRQIIGELSLKAADGLIAFRSDGRWMQSVERTEIPANSNGARLRQRGVYLITGGLGGVGLIVAEFLARNFQAKLILVGRSSLPPQQDWEQLTNKPEGRDPVADKIRKIQSLEQLGSEVLAVSGDVTNLADMTHVAALATDRFGTVNGIIHAAGVLDDGLIQLKTRESAERVLAPKVRGTLVLDAVFSQANLDFFALFSSVSSFLRPVGQVDYVAASAFLDTYSAGGRTIAINWGRWRDVGMAAHSAQSNRGLPADSGRHPFLGTRSVDAPDALVYNTTLSFDRHWILNEHRLRGGDALFPGTGYIELAWAATRDRFGSRPMQIHNLSFHEPLRAAAGETKALRLNLLRGDGVYEFSVAGSGKNYAEGSLPEYATGSVRDLPASPPRKIELRDILQRCSLGKLNLDKDGQNAKQSKHIHFGPRWRCLKEIRFGQGEAISLVELPDEFAAELQTCQAHPALLDAATGSAMLAIKDYDLTNDVYVPAAYGSFTLFAPLPRKCYCHIKWQQENNIQKEAAIFDVTILDADGVVAAQAEGLVFRRLSGSAVLSGATDIDPAAGAAAFAAILAGPRFTQIVVAPAGLKFGQERPAPAPAAAESRVARPDDEADRDDVERILSEYWEELLGVDRAGPDDDFFDLGGHSLIAVRLFAKIKKQFSVELGLATLFEARTVSSLAALIRKELGNEGAGDVPWPSMVKIRAGGSETPVFFVHGLGGNVVGFANLIRHLDPEESIYALQAQGVDGKQSLLTTVEAMAAQYISEIQMLQPKGPYYLAGYSFGGLITFEMAQQLHAQGQEVALLALFDTTQMHSRKVASPFSSPKMMGKYLRRIGQVLVDPVALDLIYKRTRNKLAQLMFFGMPTEKLIRRMYKTDAVELPKTETMIQAVNIQAAINYRPAVYPGHLTLFRAAKRSLVDRYDTYLGWGGLAGEGIDVQEVPGDHVSVGKEPNVSIMAEKLQLCIRKARSSRLQTR